MEKRAEDRGGEAGEARIPAAADGEDGATARGTEIAPGAGSDEAVRASPSVPTLRRESSPAMSCPRCGTEHDRKAVFCGSCKSYLEAPDVGKLASAKRRLVASILDSVFQDGGPIGSVLGPLLIGPHAAHGLVALLSTAYWVLTLYFWSKGTTPAKRALDMDVIREDGEPAGFWRMAFRETIGKFISWAVLGLGILSVPLDRNRQGWHDKMADTYVVFDDEK